MPDNELDEVLERLVTVFRTALTLTLQGALVRIYLQGDREMITWGRTMAGIPIAYEGPPMEAAIKYAQKHCAKLVTNMNDESKRRIAKVVADSIQNKAGINGMSKALRTEFTDMTRYRSKLIARTESCDALQQAFMDRADKMGVTGKEWVTADPCPECEANEAEGAVTIDHVFSSGHERPPAHPNCRCALAPVMLGGK